MRRRPSRLVAIAAAVLVVAGCEASVYGTPPADPAAPQLTVVAQPTYEIGRVAARLLSTAGEEDAPREIVLSPTLVVRESSTRP